MEDTASWLQNIDNFISNSFWEGQQVALLEALASGCHCLAHFWVGVEEILPEENIYISEQELLDKLIAYSKISVGEQSIYQAQSRAIACEKFDIEQTKVKICDVIRDLAA